MDFIEIQTGVDIPVVSDVADYVGDRLDDLWDRLDDLPGFKQLGEGTKDFVEGPLRDFAKKGPLGLGPVVMRAFTGMLMQGAGYLAGPWAMMMVASLPGLAKGDPLLQSLVEENFYRVTEAAKYLSLGQLNVKLPPEVEEYIKKIPDQFKWVTDEVRRLAKESGLPVEDYLDDLANRAGGSAEAAARSLAQRLGVREDMAVQAYQMLRGQRIADPQLSNYDLGTGQWFDPMEGAAFSRGAPPMVFRTPVATQTTMQNTQLSRLRNALGRPAVVAPRSSSVSSTSSSFQATLDALRATQVAASPGVVMAPPPTVDRAASPSTEDLNLLDVQSFWEKNRVVLLVGGGVLVAGIGLYLWRRR